MDNNKNVYVEEAKADKKFKFPSIKNKNAFKRGTYSIIITAVVLVAIIAFNVLVSVLSNRYMLVYDMTAEKVNTISDENIKFIKDIDNEVKVIVCAKDTEYSSMMSYYAQEYGVYDDTGAYSSYYDQTVSLIEKYGNYNSNIDVTFYDTQDSSFGEIASKYSDDNLRYGDIIVSCVVDGNERHKVVNYSDIYDLYEDDSMEMYYGYSTISVVGNKIETALTSAIAYAINTKETKVAFITGHSSEDLSENYRKLLETNNYVVDVIDEEIVTAISDEYDALFIVGPTRDFAEDELNAISNFLDNGEKYNKGLVFVADGTYPKLPNIYGFLEEWGVEFEEGILFETDSQNHLESMPTVMGMAPASEDEILDGMNYCVSSTNLPMKAAFEINGDKTTTYLYATHSTVVNAPVGTSDKWKGADEYETSQYGSVMQCQRVAYDKNSNKLVNNVIVFGSMDYVYSDFVEYPQFSNKDISFAAAERAVGAEDTGISFVTKTITDESFAASVTESAANTIKWIFMITLPLACILVGIVVYIRRRNA